MERVVCGLNAIDPYVSSSPTPVFEKLFGLESRQSEERTAFFRPRQELPFPQPPDRIVCPGSPLPPLATFERIAPAKDARTLARFQSDKGPASVDQTPSKAAA